jgi:hypothetical protein
MMRASSSGRSWSRFAAWLGVALAGQLAALCTIDAGPLLHYQHYRLPGRLLAAGDGWLLLVLAVQVLLVAAGYRTRWQPLLAWLRRSFRPWQLVVLGLVFFLPVAPVSAQPASYAAELAFAGFLQFLGLATIILVAWSLPANAVAWLQGKLERLIGNSVGRQGGVPRLDRFAWLAAIWLTVLCATLAILSYQRHPHVTDEVAYLLQARMLASGRLSLPAPPVPDAFGFYLMEFRGDRWYSVMPPGWPAMLAVGVRLGIPWLVNPILAGVNVLLAYLFVQEIYDRGLARMVVLLLCASPWFIFMGMNFMSHTFTLTCALVAAVGVARARRTGLAVWAALAGAMVGIGSIIRPLDGLIVGVLVGLWAIGIGGRRLNAPSVAALALSTLLFAAAVLPYNKALTGSPLLLPLNAYFDEHFGPGSNDYGFGPNRGLGWPLDPNPGHSPVDGLINADLNSFSLNAELFGWSTGSLLLAAVAVFAGQRRKSDVWMMAVIAAVFVALFFYYYSGGPDFGPRYWYLMIIPCVALTARGMQELGMRIGGTGNIRVTAAAGVLCLMALVSYVPWRAVDKYAHFWGMRPDVRVLAEKYDFGRSLVLIRGDSHPDYTSAAIYNPLDFGDAVPIYAWDRDPGTRNAVLTAFADRPVWLVDGPTLSGQGYRVVAGPMLATDILTGAVSLPQASSP